MCGADNGWPRMPFCRPCFGDSACGAGQRCNPSPSPQPVVRGLPRGPPAWTCYASGEEHRHGWVYCPEGEGRKETRLQLQLDGVVQVQASAALHFTAQRRLLPSVRRHQPPPHSPPAAAPPPPQPPHPTPLPPAGTFTSLPACSHGSRRGGFYLPRGWEAAQPLPLAVVLHPFASSGQEFADSFFRGWADVNKVGMQPAVACRSAAPCATQLHLLSGLACRGLSRPEPLLCLHACCARCPSAVLPSAMRFSPSAPVLSSARVTPRPSLPPTCSSSLLPPQLPATAGTGGTTPRQ